jgi:hypothetical protein
MFNRAGDRALLKDLAVPSILAFIDSSWRRFQSRISSSEYVLTSLSISLAHF